MSDINADVRAAIHAARAQCRRRQQDFDVENALAAVAPFLDELRAKVAELELALAALNDAVH